MERFIRIGLVLLVISLALNISLLTRVNNLDEMVANHFNQLRNEGLTIRSLTQQNTDRINQAMNTIETEQRWITPVDIAGVKQAGDNTVVLLSWVIKDYLVGTPVTFHYRKQGGSEFVSQQAITKGDGRFEIELLEKLEAEPDWKMGTSYINVKNGDSKTRAVAEEVRPAGRKNMEYYITVKDGTRLKSSEISSINLDDISRGLYSPLAAEVQIDQEREYYRVFLTQHIIDSKQVNLAQASLEAYLGDKLVVQNKLRQDDSKLDGSVRIYNTQWDYKGVSFDRVLLKVEYENGKQFNKEISGRL